MEYHQKSPPLLARLLREILQRVPWLAGRYLLAEVVADLLKGEASHFYDNLGPFIFPYDLEDQIQRQMYFNLYDPEEAGFLRKVLGKGDVFIDGGANVGFYSLIASPCVGSDGKIHAFEPVPSNVDKLKAVIQINGIDNIMVHEVALANKNKKMTFFLPNEEEHITGWGSMIPSPRRQRKIEVQAVRLDDCLQLSVGSRLSAIKLDIEGSEPEAIEGAREVILSHKPTIICEYNPYLLVRGNRRANELVDLISGLGYDISTIGRDGVTPLQTNSFPSQPANLICVPGR